MKVLFRKDAAAALAQAQDDLSATETAIAELQREYDSQKLHGDPVELEQLRRKIEDLDRPLKLYRERIEILQPRLAQEQIERRQKEYQAAVNKIEKAITGLASVAAEVEAAIRAVPVALERFRSAQQAALRAFPDNVQRPFTDELGLDRIENILFECFRPFSPEWAKEAHEHWTLERKLENVREAIAGFAKAESAGYEAMIARLREQAPQPAPEQEIIAA